jgi:Golgi phosphoprotein 3
MSTPHIERKRVSGWYASRSHGGATTVLTVTEEFLLLTATNSEHAPNVLVVDLPKSRLGIKVAMSGAALMELALRDRIETDVDNLWVRDSTPTGEKSLDSVLARIAATSQGDGSKSPISAAIKSLEEIDSYQLALESLEARGLVRRQNERLLWVFREQHVVVTDLDPVTQIRKRVHDVLLEDEFPSPRDVCLISLLNATKKFRSVVPPESVQKAIDQTNRYVNLDLVGRNVANHVSTLIASLQKYGDIV